MFKLIGDFLYGWQTLIGGGLALVGAWITVRALDRQARQDADRKARAARVMLPATLSALVDYSIESVRWLESVREKAELSEKGSYSGSIAVATCPRPDPCMLKALRDCVEFLDMDHSRYISELVSKIQIQSAWIAGLHDYFVNYQLYRGKRFGLNGEIDQSAVKSIRLVAKANKLFPYSRLETDDRPTPLDFEAVRVAFKTCHLEEVTNVTVWNALTTPYLKSVSTQLNVGTLTAWAQTEFGSDGIVD